MNLLQAFLNIIDQTRPAFCKKQAFIRARELALASVCAFGRKTITSLAIYLGRDKNIPSSDYKFYSTSKWSPNALFDSILKLAIPLINGDKIVLAVDDTRIRKTGKRIPNAGWTIDPLGPKFTTTLIWALRYLQISILFPLYETSESSPARSVPIRFLSAPFHKKPGKKGSKEDWENYKKNIKNNNLSTLYVKAIQEIRSSLDQMGYSNKKLMIVQDGSFCNKICMNINDDRIQLIARCKKNSVLCFKAKNGRKKYEEKTFTPEDIRLDKEIPWIKVKVFYGGCWRELRCKEVKNVCWRSGTKTKPLRAVVLAPIPYIRRGIRNYRNPAYLLSTCNEASLESIVQDYLDRWQIEYNHRDEKSILGVGEAQVRNIRSVIKQPAFHVAAYSALLLANIKVYQDRNHADLGDTPRWREPPKRNTIRALVGSMRASIIEFPHKLVELEITVGMISAILRKAA